MNTEDDWDKLSNKEQEKIREMVSKDWQDIRVHAQNFDTRVANPKKRSKTGILIVKFKFEGEERQTITNALDCGYRYRNQKNKPWEKKENETTIQ